MSNCMIVRRGGGGGEGFDPNGAVLKVITSTGCTVLVTGTGYSKTHQQADGFPRVGDANVTEHFFSIPASAFGTITVKATNTYGDNTKTLTVDTAGKVYEQLCGGINIILNSTFGLQEGFSISGSYYTYNDRDKCIEGPNASVAADLSPAVSVAPYEYMTVSFSSTSSSYNASMSLQDPDRSLVYFEHQGTSITQQTKALSDKYYPTATIHIGARVQFITEIVLS